MADKIKIKIILGSIREGRFGERPATWISDELKNWEGVDAELVDLKDYPMPLFDAPKSPAWMGMKYPNDVVQKWSAKMNEADAYIIVAPEYNHGYSSAVKNALDWLSPEWGRKPVGFVSYGSASGARAIEQMRMVAIELNMVPIKRSIGISWEYMAKVFADPKISNADLLTPLRKGAGGQDHLAMFMDDLMWVAKALKSARTPQQS